jgi:hypothetical protein
MPDIPDFKVAPSSSRHWVAVLFTIGWYGLHGSLRRLGHAGIDVGTCTPGTTGRMRLDGMDLEKAIDVVAVPLGTV